MESNSTLGFLDDTSLLNTPKSPQQASTCRKENKQIREPYRSTFNQISNSIKNDVKDDFLLNDINLIPNIPAKKLDLNFSGASFNSSIDSNSSLGLISWNKVKDFGSLELNEPPLPSSNRPNNIKNGIPDTQGALEGKAKIQNTNSADHSSALPQSDYSDTGTLTEEEKLFIVYGETSKELKMMLAGLNDTSSSRESLTPHEQLFILYGEQSREMKEMLSELENKNNDLAIKGIEMPSPDLSKTSCLQNEDRCVSPESSVSNVCNVDKISSLYVTGNFPTSSKESPFQEASLAYHDLMTPPSSKPNINRWLSGVESSFINEKTITPSRANPFSNKSSFLLDDLYDLYTSNPELKIDSASLKTDSLCIKDQSDVAVTPIPMKQASSFVESSSFAESLEPDVSYVEEDMEIVSTDYKKESYMMNNQNTNRSSLYFGKNQYIPDTSLAFCSDILAEFEAEKQNFEKFNFSKSEFVSAKEGLEMVPYSENSFEEENLPEMNMCNSKASMFSTWSMPSQNEFICRPSWWSDVNETKSKISIGHVFASRSENVGVLSTDKNRERPYFGNAISSPPRSLDYSAMHNDANVSFENDTGRDFTSFPSQIVNDSYANDSALISLIDSSTISHIAAEISMSDRRSVVADKYLNAVFQKKSKNFCSKNQGRNINTGLNKDVKISDLLKEASSSEFSLKPQSENNSTLINEFENSQQLKQSSLEPEHVKEFVNDFTQSKKDLQTEINKLHPIECHSNLNSVSLKNEGTQSDVTFKPSQSKPVENLQNVTGKEARPCNNICAQDLEPFLKTSETASKNFLTDTQQTFHSDVPSLQDTQSLALNNSIYSLTSSQESTSTNQSSAHPCCVHTQGRPGSSCSSACSATIQNVPCLSTPCVSGYSNPHNPYLLTLIPNPNYFPSSISNLPTMGMMGSQVPYLHTTNVGSINNLASNLPISTAMQVQSLPLGLSGSGINTCVVAPVEYNHPLICLGDIAYATVDLKNPINSNLFYHLSFTSASLNNAPIPVTSVEAHVQDRVFAAAGTSVSVPLKFVPRLEGKIQLTLEVSSSLSGTKEPLNSTIGLPCFITVNLETEKPFLCLSCQGQDWLDFPAVIEGSSITETITLSYSCRASFPVWLDISEDDGVHSLCFSELELNSASDRANVLESMLLTPRQMFCHLTGAESSSQYKSIKIPITFKAGKCSKKKKEAITFILSAGIGRSTNKPSTLMKVSATVGTVILSIHKHTIKSIVFKAPENGKVSYALNVINTGTISATVDLAVNCERDDFVITPPTIQLEPQKIIPLNLYFKPSASENIKGMFQAAMRPCGETFDLAPVEGQVATKWISAAKHSYRNFESENKHIIDSAMPIIETDKKFLAWGGAKIEADACKRITIRNTSATKSFTANVFIKEKNDCFKIIDDKNQIVESLQFELKPFSVKYIKVKFSPHAVSVFNGHLIIKPSTVGHGLFRIPLSGYGGLSEVYLLDFPKSQNGRSGLEVTFNSSIGMGFNEVKLRNCGSRAAYVKVVEKHNSDVDDLKFRVEPSEFIIAKYQTTTITVSYSRSSRDPFINNKLYCGKLLFFYGDEILRQKLRRSRYKTNPNMKFNLEVQSLDFNLPFIGEDLIAYDESYPDSPKDSYLFYSSVKVLHLDVNLKSQDENSTLAEYFSTLSLVPDISSDHTSQEDSSAQSI